MRRKGFTLIELLVVITIVLLISVVAIPLIVPAISHRQVSEAARIVQGAIVGARDEAIHNNQPSGIRLIPDPAFPLARLANGQIDPSQPLVYNRIVPIGPAPAYSEGGVSTYPDAVGGSSNYSAAFRTVNGQAGVPCLVIEAAVVDSAGFPTPPTNWFWNIRVGDKITIGPSGGKQYTVVGPMAVTPAQGNSEMFVNIGPPGTALPTLNGPQPCEYLLLVNGRDDNKDGWVDSGFDGVDNNGNLIIDELAEWELEAW